MSGVRKSERKNPQRDLPPKPSPSYNEVKKKFGMENMTIEELTVFLRHTSRWLGTDLTTKSVKNYIKTICDHSDGLLRPDDFKENPENPKSSYCIRPECQGLLIVLINSEYFDGRKNDRRLKTRSDLNNQLAKNVREYLTDSDKQLVLNNPSYVNAELEAQLSRQINQQLITLLRTMYHVSPVIRYKLMMEFLKQLVSLNDWMSRQDSKETAARMVYAHELDEIHDALYQKGLFSSKSLDELLINLLAFRMHDKEFTYIKDNEEMTPIGVYLATLIFQGGFPEESEAQKKMNDIDRAVENQSLYQCIQEKAKKILDLSNPFEEQMYYDLMNMAKIRCCTPYVSPEEYDRMVRFTESAIANDKWDILSKFWELDNQILSRHDMEKN